MSKTEKMVDYTITLPSGRKILVEAVKKTGEKKMQSKLSAYTSTMKARN